jgi:hypothetical protein
MRKVQSAAFTDSMLVDWRAAAARVYPVDGLVSSRPGLLLRTFVYTWFEGQKLHMRPPGLAMVVAQKSR